MVSNMALPCDQRFSLIWLHLGLDLFPGLGDKEHILTIFLSHSWKNWKLGKVRFFAAVAFHIFSAAISWETFCSNVLGVEGAFSIYWPEEYVELDLTE